MSATEIAIVHAFKSLHDEVIAVRAESAAETEKLRDEIEKLKKDVSDLQNGKGEEEKEKKRKLINKRQNERVAANRFTCGCGGVSSKLACRRLLHEGTELHKGWASK
jgi:hypothetical protein